jgi:methyl-accepting chemotaxis protein
MIMASSSSRDLILRWVGDTKQLVSSTKDVDKAVDKSSKNAQDQGDKAGKGFGENFKSGVKKIAATLGGLFILDKIKDFAKEAYAEAREAQKVGAQTTAVIK